ncbi:MAG: tRNA (adenosine(37)-N6)-threonylcarbamoyltransferase complex ATPase subunit type 1 TsaE, partial [Steroidobacteraceae bacterium]|nr:tRNA (adenosine(37)-N6)-threonylcarbamoyltransferase complex ATPase subunit type 1 TsaE [Steroidobacteraceae bacterium]MDW8259718.1 tRNA (adenosine(37)-N6)-threonylcarbamoyltransferase complex ATPase subunit type 1 TsaE [Gammaproteobacteria bacterium]
RTAQLCQSAVTPLDSRRFVTTAESETRALAARCATACIAEPTAPISDRCGARRLWLSGDLGSGKTTWVRGFLEGLGVTETIASPSYAVMATYRAGDWDCVHADFYRLSDPRELEPLALDQYDHSQALWLIEWAEKGSALPVPDLWLHFAIDRDGRHVIDVRAHSKRGVGWLRSL